MAEKKLGKPQRGGPKKYQVYVKNDKGNVVKVSFGDPDMEIKRDDPERRKNFRARHNCDDPGPRWKARYWSCKFWSDKPVSSLLKGESKEENMEKIEALIDRVLDNGSPADLISNLGMDEPILDEETGGDVAIPADVMSDITDMEMDDEAAPEVMVFTIDSAETKAAFGDLCQALQAAGVQYSKEYDEDTGEAAVAWGSEDTPRVNKTMMALGIDGGEDLDDTPEATVDYYESLTDRIREMLDVETTELSEAFKRIKKLPPNTELYDATKWSTWNGFLAIMHMGPDYYDINKQARESTFNAATRSRLYSIRFATDNNGRRVKVKDKMMIGSDVVIEAPHPPYAKARWEWRYGSGPRTTGRFEPKVEEFDVEVPLKELGPAEIAEVKRLLDSYGYMDGTGYIKLTAAKARKMMKETDFEKTQDMPSDIANAAFELVQRRNFRSSDAKEDQMTWDTIRGLYVLTNKQDKFKYVIIKGQQGAGDAF